MSLQIKHCFIKILLVLSSTASNRGWTNHFSHFRMVKYFAGRPAGVGRQMNICSRPAAAPEHPAVMHLLFCKTIISVFVTPFRLQNISKKIARFQHKGDIIVNPINILCQLFYVNGRHSVRLDCCKLLPKWHSPCWPISSLPEATSEVKWGRESNTKNVAFSTTPLVHITCSSGLSVDCYQQL